MFMWALDVYSNYSHIWIVIYTDFIGKFSYSFAYEIFDSWLKQLISNKINGTGIVLSLKNHDILVEKNGYKIAK